MYENDAFFMIVPEETDFQRERNVMLACLIERYDNMAGFLVSSSGRQQVNVHRTFTTSNIYIYVVRYLLI